METKVTVMTDAEILEHLRGVLLKAFEVDPAKVQPESHLFEDLDLDSIDAVDLVIELQELTGKRIKPEEFKSVRTVKDVILSVRRLLEG